jgi:hypothetical protein
VEIQDVGRPIPVLLILLSLPHGVLEKDEEVMWLELPLVLAHHELHKYEMFAMQTLI